VPFGSLGLKKKHQFFHNFATNMRRGNTTWKVKDAPGNCISSLMDLHLEVFWYIGNLC